MSYYLEHKEEILDRSRRNYFIKKNGLKFQEQYKKNSKLYWEKMKINEEYMNKKHVGSKNFRKINPFYSRNWKRNNPVSHSYNDIKLSISMNSVRKRDNNACQWLNCKKILRNIHVHHIFPRSEYPELQYEGKSVV